MHKEIIIVRAWLCWVCSGHFVIPLRDAFERSACQHIVFESVVSKEAFCISVFLAKLCVCSKNAVLFYGVQRTYT